MKNFILGPFDDLRRFIKGAIITYPPTRLYAESALNTARQTLSKAGCDLSRCTVENLHTFPVDMEPEQLSEHLMSWQQWPRSSFFACSSFDKQGESWFSYRWYNLLPIVLMKLKLTQRGHFIIYDIVKGIGPGGYHTFLINQVDLPPAFKAYQGQTTLSIFTTFPQMRFFPFPEGIHDQVNYDIYRKLAESR
jgi:hypothetical protein